MASPVAGNNGGGLSRPPSHAHAHASWGGEQSPSFLSSATVAAAPAAASQAGPASSRTDLPLWPVNVSGSGSGNQLATFYARSAAVTPTARPMHTSSNSLDDSHVGRGLGLAAGLNRAAAAAAVQNKGRSSLGAGGVAGLLAAATKSGSSGKHAAPSVSSLIARSAGSSPRISPSTSLNHLSANLPASMLASVSAGTSTGTTIVSTNTPRGGPGVSVPTSTPFQSPSPSPAAAPAVPMSLPPPVHLTASVTAGVVGGGGGATSDDPHESFILFLKHGCYIHPKSKRRLSASKGSGAGASIIPWTRSTSASPAPTEHSGMEQREARATSSRPTSATPSPASSAFYNNARPGSVTQASLASGNTSRASSPPPPPTMSSNPVGSSPGKKSPFFPLKKQSKDRRLSILTKSAKDRDRLNNSIELDGTNVAARDGGSSSKNTASPPSSASTINPTPKSASSPAPALPQPRAISRSSRRTWLPWNRHHRHTSSSTSAQSGSTLATSTTSISQGGSSQQKQQSPPSDDVTTSKSTSKSGHTHTRRLSQLPKLLPRLTLKRTASLSTVTAFEQAGAIDGESGTPHTPTAISPLLLVRNHTSPDTLASGPSMPSPSPTTPSNRMRASSGSTFFNPGGTSTGCAFVRRGSIIAEEDEEADATSTSTSTPSTAGARGSASMRKPSVMRHFSMAEIRPHAFSRSGSEYEFSLMRHGSTSELDTSLGEHGETDDGADYRARRSSVANFYSPAPSPRSTTQPACAPVASTDTSSASPSFSATTNGPSRGLLKLHIDSTDDIEATDPATPCLRGDAQSPRVVVTPVHATRNNSLSSPRSSLGDETMQGIQRPSHLMIQPSNDSFGAIETIPAQRHTSDTADAVPSVETSNRDPDSMSSEWDPFSTERRSLMRQSSLVQGDGGGLPRRRGGEGDLTQSYVISSHGTLIAGNFAISAQGLHAANAGGGAASRRSTIIADAQRRREWDQLSAHASMTSGSITTTSATPAMAGSPAGPQWPADDETIASGPMHTVDSGDGRGQAQTQGQGHGSGDPSSSPPSHREHALRASDLCTLGVIGKGQNGVVLKAIHLPSLTRVALKSIYAHDRGTRHQLLHELTAYLKFDSPFLLSFLGAYHEDGIIFLATEYMDAGSLSQFIARHGPLATRPRVFRQIAWQCVRGLATMHEARTLHRDIKADNILLEHTGRCVLADFGLLKQLPAGEDMSHTFLGTMSYLAPERIQSNAYTYSSDVWSLGLCLTYAATGVPPKQHPDFFMMLHVITTQPPEPLTPEKHGLDVDACDFINGMLVMNPEKRYTCQQLLEHPFLTGVRRHDQPESESSIPALSDPSYPNIFIPQTADISDPDSDVWAVDPSNLEDLDLILEFLVNKHVLPELRANTSATAATATSSQGSSNGASVAEFSSSSPVISVPDSASMLSSTMPSVRSGSTFTPHTAEHVGSSSEVESTPMAASAKRIDSSIDTTPTLRLPHSSQSNQQDAVLGMEEGDIPLIETFPVVPTPSDGSAAAMHMAMATTVESPRSTPPRASPTSLSETAPRRFDEPPLLMMNTPTSSPSPSTPSTPTPPTLVSPRAFRPPGLTLRISAHESVEDSAASNIAIITEPHPVLPTDPASAEETMDDHAFSSSSSSSPPHTHTHAHLTVRISPASDTDSAAGAIPVSTVIVPSATSSSSSSGIGIQREDGDIDASVPAVTSGDDDGETARGSSGLDNRNQLSAPSASPQSSTVSEGSSTNGHELNVELLYLDGERCDVLAKQFGLSIDEVQERFLAKQRDMIRKNRVRIGRNTRAA